MKIKSIIGWVLLSLTCNASAAFYSYYWDDINGTIPDGSASGYANSQTLSGITDYSMIDINVTLNISGGYNGDLYGYVFHDSGFAVLLNRAGLSSSSSFGYGDAGFGPDASANRFTLDDDLGSDVHLYGAASYTLYNGQLTGAWQPDGRNIDPLSFGASFDTAARDAMLTSFDGGDPNGSWTLFFADLSGGSQSTLVGWGLEITAVPEPTHIALGIFGMFLGGISLGTRLLRKRNET